MNISRFENKLNLDQKDISLEEYLKESNHDLEELMKMKRLYTSNTETMTALESAGLLTQHKELEVANENIIGDVIRFICRMIEKACNFIKKLINTISTQFKKRTEWYSKKSEDIAKKAEYWTKGDNIRKEMFMKIFRESPYSGYVLTRKNFQFLDDLVSSDLVVTHNGFCLNNERMKLLYKVRNGLSTYLDNFNKFGNPVSGSSSYQAWEKTQDAIFQDLLKIVGDLTKAISINIGYPDSYISIPEELNEITVSNISFDELPDKEFNTIEEYRSVIVGNTNMHGEVVRTLSILTNETKSGVLPLLNTLLEKSKNNSNVFSDTRIMDALEDLGKKYIEVQNKNIEVFKLTQELLYQSTQSIYDALENAMKLYPEDQKN